MGVTLDDVIARNLSQDDIAKCIHNASTLLPHISDRNDLHQRDYLERFIDVLIGEVAELIVIRWLRDNGKFAVSAVDKSSGSPDLGHDIWVIDKENNCLSKTSIKSSISAKLNPDRILKEMRLAARRLELCEFNIQVYFWLKIDAQKDLDRSEVGHRIVVPAISQSAIMCWFSNDDLQNEVFSAYKVEKRQAPNVQLSSGRAMATFLDRVADLGEFKNLEWECLVGSAKNDNLLVVSTTSRAKLEKNSIGPTCTVCGNKFVPKIEGALLCFQCWKAANGRSKTA